MKASCHWRKSERRGLHLGLEAWGTWVGLEDEEGMHRGDHYERASKSGPDVGLPGRPWGCPTEVEMHVGRRGEGRRSCAGAPGTPSALWSITEAAMGPTGAFHGGRSGAAHSRRADTRRASRGTQRPEGKRAGSWERAGPDACLALQPSPALPTATTRAA